MTENSQVTDSFFENESTQMAFSITGSRALGLSSDKPAEKVCEFLAHHIARKPQDLMVHVQRIKLAVDHDLEPVLHGALLDLFIALGPRGYALRKCMYDLASKVLDKESIQYLADGLEKGIKANDPIAEQGVSVLCRSIMGSIELVEIDQPADDPGHGPLEQALANIECSQLEDAQDVLEQSVRADASSLEQQILLLDLYRKTDNKTRFSAFYSTLDEGAMLNPQAWREMADHFGIEG
ncbi:MAG: hypothetical protein GY726_15975 [Proteobacteria bacterium]|nr:hypothetical protein [Pseudomonadota bacterium]